MPDAAVDNRAEARRTLIGETVDRIRAIETEMGVTRASLPRLLLGGWPKLSGLDARQLHAWKFHHRFGSGGLSLWRAKWGPGRSLRSGLGSAQNS